eukprot:gene36924-45551_t
MPEIVNTKPSVLQKIREMKYTAKKLNTVHRNQKDILTHVKAATERAKQVKSGHSLGAHLELPTAEMTVDWAVNFVAVNESGLVDLFIQFDASLKDFDKQQQQAQIAAHATTLNSARLVEAAMEGFGATNISESIPVPTTNHRSPHRVRDSSKNSHAPPTSSAKPPSLAVQLENLKLSGTESFVSSISSPAVPTAPAGRKSVDITSHAPQFHRSLGVAFSNNTKDNTGSGDNNQAHGLSTIAEPSGKSHAPPRKIPSSSSGGGSHSHSHRVVRIGGQTTAPSAVGASHVEALQLVEEDSSRPSTAQDPALALQSPSGACPPVQQFNRGRARARTSSNMDSSANDDEEDDDGGGGDSPRLPSPTKAGAQTNTSKQQRQVKKKNTVSSPRAPHVAASSRVYSNANVSTPVAPPNGSQGAGNVNASTLEELIATQRMFKQSMSHSNSLYESAIDKTKQLQEVIEAKLKRGNRGGQRIVNQWLSFRGVHVQQRQAANEVCQNKEFFRAIETLENLHCFQMDGYDRNDESNKLGVNVAKDIQYMRKNAALNSQLKIMSRLLATKWFCTIVAKTRDYMKRMNNNIPICCLKFLTIFQYLLSYDYPLTVDLFYRVLESTVVIKEDYIRNIVHVVIKAARDALKISPQDFLAYLEGRNIQPCPELLNQIRAMAAAASQAQFRLQSPRSAARHTPSENRGGILLGDEEDGGGGLAFTFSGLSPRGGGGGGGGESILLSGSVGVMEGTEPE